jgi:tetratricopeptide (TPR) repeat protein
MTVHPALHLRPRARCWLAALLGACTMTGAHAQSACGPITSSYGPFDYRTQRAQLKIVEDYHFNAGVEAGIRGQSAGTATGDISYLMNTSPNHHRGLMSILRIAERTKSPHPPGLQYSVECYFERALRFQPDDTVVRAMYAQYLHTNRRMADARAQLDAAVGHAGDRGLSHYNLGLVYFDIGEYDRALAQAHKARSLGFDRADLEQRLKAAGKWKNAD